MRTRLAGIPLTLRPDGLDGGPPESAPRLNIGGGVPPTEPSDGPTDPKRDPPAGGPPKLKLPLDEPLAAGAGPLLEVPNPKGAVRGIAAKGFDVAAVVKPTLVLAGANAAPKGEAVERPLPNESEGGKAAAGAEAAEELEDPNEKVGAVAPLEAA